MMTKSLHHPLPFFERSSSDLQRQATDELEILRNWMLQVGARATTPDAPQKKTRQGFFCWRQPINHEKMMKKWLNPTENLMESKKMSNNSLKFTSNSFVNSLGIDFHPFLTQTIQLRVINAISHRLSPFVVTISPL